MRQSAQNCVVTRGPTVAHLLHWIWLVTPTTDEQQSMAALGRLMNEIGHLLQIRTTCLVLWVEMYLFKKAA